MNSKLVWLLVGGMLAGGGCGRDAGEDRYVARVGDAVLTIEELREYTGGDTLEAARAFVASWVTNQMLYQEARRRGYVDANEVVRQVEEAKRQLAINALLQHEVFNADTATINDERLQQEFEAHRDALRLREDVVNISFVIFGERDAANAFRSKLLQGKSWKTAFDEVNAEMPGAMLREAAHHYYTQATLYPEELWKAASMLKPEEVSYAIRSPAGYAVMIVHATKKQGEIPDFDYVKEEVRSRFLLQQRRRRYNELLAQLRSQHDIEVHLSNHERPPHE